MDLLQVSHLDINFLLATRHLYTVYYIIKDTSGQRVLSFIERFPLFGG